MHRSVPVHYNCMTVYGVTTCLENLEMLLRKFASVQGNVNKSHGSVEKKTCRGYWSETSYLHLFFTLLSLCISFWFRIIHCSIPTSTTHNNTSTGLVVWLSGNALASINVVALRQTRLVPGWVTVSVCNQPARSTQPSTLCGTVK